jgi:hypothetical protein
VPAVAGALFFFVGLALLAQLNGESTVWDATWRAVFLGAGMGFTMPTLSAAAMASLPPQVAGVGSGSLNTLRQVGFSLGLAIVVAIFSHTVVDAGRTATKQAVRYVQQQTELPAVARDVIAAGIVKAAAQAESGESGLSSIDEALEQAPQAPPGSALAETLERLKEEIGDIYRDNVAGAFTWPFYAAAVAALLAVVPAALTGRRLGEHQGDHLSRAEPRAAGPGPAEAEAAVAEAAQAE